jgi:nucleotide-binding universal stress UspA family protein
MLGPRARSPPDTAPPWHGTKIPWVSRIKMKGLSHILVPVDVCSVAWEPLEYAGWLAARTGAITDLFYVIPALDGGLAEAQEEALEILLSLLASLTERFTSLGDPDATATDPVFVGNLLPGHPAESILQFAARGDHDVIIMGTRNRTGVSHKGSIAERVVRHAHSPVLIVPRAPEGSDILASTARF